MVVASASGKPRGGKRKAYCQAQPILTCNFSPIGDGEISGYAVLRPVWIPGYWRKTHWRKGYWKDDKWVKPYLVKGYWRKAGCATHIHAKVSGLENPMHGWHIHEYGDVGDKVKGLRTGGHYTNPYGLPTKAGLPSDPNRNWGELGNLRSNKDGEAVYNRLDTVIAFTQYINGRALTIHEKEDFGRQPETPGSGARVAQCVLGMRNPDMK